MQTHSNRNQPYILREGEGWTYRYGIDFTVKASEVQEGSSMSFVEYTTRKGEEPPEHMHETENEIFYVLEGALTFHCGEESFEVEKNGFIYLPHGIKHGYTIHTDDPVRLIFITSPVREGTGGGWGGFVADLESGQGELVSKPLGAGL
jgi:quercetin dioxygenase-like cupin family protein